MLLEANPVSIGIDAAVVANHHVVVRHAGAGGEAVEDFVVAPTLAGMEILTKRLSEWPGVFRTGEHECVWYMRRRVRQFVASGVDSSDPPGLAPVGAVVDRRSNQCGRPGSRR